MNNIQTLLAWASADVETVEVCDVEDEASARGGPKTKPLPRLQGDIESKGSTTIKTSSSVASFVTSGIEVLERRAFFKGNVVVDDPLRRLAESKCQYDEMTKIAETKGEHYQELVNTVKLLNVAYTVEKHVCRSNFSETAEGQALHEKALTHRLGALDKPTRAKVKSAIEELDQTHPKRGSFLSSDSGNEALTSKISQVTVHSNCRKPTKVCVETSNAVLRLSANEAEYMQLLAVAESRSGRAYTKLVENIKLCNTAYYVEQHVARVDFATDNAGHEQYKAELSKWTESFHERFKKAEMAVKELDKRYPNRGTFAMAVNFTASVDSGNELMQLAKSNDEYKQLLEAQSRNDSKLMQAIQWLHEAQLFEKCVTRVQFAPNQCGAIKYHEALTAFQVKMKNDFNDALKAIAQLDEVHEWRGRFSKARLAAQESLEGGVHRERREVVLARKYGSEDDVRLFKATPTQLSPASWNRGGHVGDILRAMRGRSESAPERANTPLAKEECPKRLTNAEELAEELEEELAEERADEAEFERAWPTVECKKARTRLTNAKELAKTTSCDRIARTVEQCRATLRAMKTRSKSAHQAKGWDFHEKSCPKPLKLDAQCEEVLARLINAEKLTEEANCEDVAVAIAEVPAAAPRAPAKKPAAAKVDWQTRVFNAHFSSFDLELTPGERTQKKREDSAKKDVRNRSWKRHFGHTTRHFHHKRVDWSLPGCSAAHAALFAEASPAGGNIAKKHKK